MPYPYKKPTPTPGTLKLLNSPRSLVWDSNIIRGMHLRKCPLADSLNNWIKSSPPETQSSVCASKGRSLVSRLSQGTRMMPCGVYRFTLAAVLGTFLFSCLTLGLSSFQVFPHVKKLERENERACMLHCSKLWTDDSACISVIYNRVYWYCIIDIVLLILYHDFWSYVFVIVSR